MSEEKRKEENKKNKTTKRLYIYFAIASFVLGLFSCMMMLYFWIDVFVDVPYRLDSVLRFLNISDAVFHYIILILHLLAFLSTFLAFILGIWAYFKMTYKEHRLSKILALCGIVLSLFHWALVFLQYTEWAGGYLV
ncbi:MAG: hypothetical protein ACYS32_15845 [Planctomycetota bacterium]|jgi:hypothetical protein